MQPLGAGTGGLPDNGVGTRSQPTCMKVIYTPGPHLQLGGQIGWCWMDFSHHMVVGKENKYTKLTEACWDSPCDNEPNQCLTHCTTVTSMRTLVNVRIALVERAKLAKIQFSNNFIAGTCVVQFVCYTAH